MIWILAVRDRDTGKVPELRPMTDAEVEGMAELFAKKRQQYPPPRYDLMHARARSIEEFTRLYPRYKQTGGGGGNGGDPVQPTGTKPSASAAPALGGR